MFSSDVCLSDVCCVHRA